MIRFEACSATTERVCGHGSANASTGQIIAGVTLTACMFVLLWLIERDTTS